MLQKQQIEQVKTQLIQQIQENFPEDKKSTAISQIQEMNESELENFLKQNNLIKDSNQQTECVFCAIASGSIPSRKINENSEAIAVLELNPISKAHVLIIPKDHSIKKEDLIKKTKALQEEISKKIKLKFKPKEILVASANLFGHEIINIVPIYKDEKIDSKRYKAEEKELELVQETLLKKIKPKLIKKPKPEKIEKSEQVWLPKRIP